MYKFCIAVLRHEFGRSKWQPLLSIYRKLDRTLDVLLGLGVIGGILYLIYKYIPILDHKRGAAIVILLSLVLLAGWFLGAVKRFHKNTLAEIYEAQEEMNRQLEWSAKRIEFLTLLEGRSDALYLLLENRRWNDNDNAGIAIAKSEIKYHEADIYNTFRDRFGSVEVEDYFRKLGTVPENLSGQVARINAHRNKLHELLQFERAQQLQINQKAISQKQDALQHVGKN